MVAVLYYTVVRQVNETAELFRKGLLLTVEMLQRRPRLLGKASVRRAAGQIE
jgi:hypothetical protein